ncbi:phage tail protein [Streptomyces sp. IB201691-2A2]|uniref:phage tail protein n=1 Tax=Streptomyces sp. IB201691-2A2 TaxID=2561920 RepID=UPI00117E1FDF|nr:phage tail protein [Streptomyces sp. IB201691-2A2]TRO58525.1 phage tail protein [Streptomyces sp. IB201691-2A2]
MTELVQTFRFHVRLTRSVVPSRTTVLPPALDGSGAGTPAVGPGTPPSGLDRLGDGGFQECSGLGLEADLRELSQGGDNDHVVRRAGRVKLQPLILKRGMFTATEGGSADTSLWEWLQNMTAGGRAVSRYDGDVDVYDASARRIVAHWKFVRGLPLKISGPTLNARTGEIAVEELHIAHEGLRLERVP